MVIVNITKCIYRNNRADFKLTDLHGVTSDAGFHAEIHPLKFTDGCSCTCTEVSILVIVKISILTGFISHRLIRAAVWISYGQVKKIRLADKRYLSHTYIKTDVLFFQKLHDTAAGIQPECTASSEKYGMDRLCIGKRLKKFAFPRSRTAPADIKPCAHAAFTQDNGTACSSLDILCISNADPWKVFDTDNVHYIPP